MSSGNSRKQRSRTPRRGRAFTRTGLGCAAACCLVLIPISPGQGRLSAAPVKPATTALPGELAVVSGGRLVLLTGHGSPYVVAGRAVASQPAWSPDGKWVAFLRTPKAPAPTNPSPSLWVARAGGTGAHRVSPAGAGVTEFAWAAARDGERLVFSVLYANSYSSKVLLATASPARLHSLGSYTDLIGFSVAPSGDELAVSYRKGAPPASGKAPAWEGVLQVRPLSAGPGRTAYTLPGGGYVLLAPGWWRDGKGLLFWDDPAGSASIAADGLALDSLNLATRKVSALGTMLTYPDWVSWSPGGRSLAFVAGGDRVIWDAGKHVVVCAMPSASCRSVALRSARLMTLDPIWSAAGSLVYDVAPGARSPSASTPPGLPTAGTAPWSQRNVAAWYAAMHLYVASASGTGGHLLAGAGGGAHDPRAVPGGLLFVRGDGLWYLPGDARRAAMKVAGGLASPGPYGNYYGYIAWYQDFAWHA